MKDKKLSCHRMLHVIGNFAVTCFTLTLSLSLSPSLLCHFRDVRHRIMAFAGHSVCESVCVQDDCRSNQLISLKVGPTSREN